MGYVWLIGGIALLIGEIFTPGFVVACFGVAGMLTSVLAFIGMGWRGQLIGFILTTALVLVTLRPLLLKASGKTRTNTDALIGQIGIVREQIVDMPSSGRVLVGGEDWRAASEDGDDIDIDQKVTIVRVEGTKLIVKRSIEGGSQWESDSL